MNPRENGGGGRNRRDEGVAVRKKFTVSKEVKDAADRFAKETGNTVTVALIVAIDRYVHLLKRPAPERSWGGDRYTWSVSAVPMGTVSQITELVGQYSEENPRESDIVEAAVLATLIIKN